MSFLLFRPRFKILLLLFFLFFSFSIPSVTFALSDYVLPYPSAMPGSKIYLLHTIEEKLSKYWYFGDYGSFTYNRQLADKYLVQAKTLFEYKQYLLGVEALTRSNNYFKQMVAVMQSVPDSRNGKNEKNLLMKSAAEKHIEILKEMKREFPQRVVWQAEKRDPIILNLSSDLDKGISIRRGALSL